MKNFRKKSLDLLYKAVTTLDIFDSSHIKSAVAFFFNPPVYTPFFFVLKLRIVSELWFFFSPTTLNLTTYSLNYLEIANINWIVIFF